MAAVSDLAADDAVLTCDSGTIATWAARHWTIRVDRQFYLSGNLATMAPGLPYAIAVQHAYPGRQVIAFVGDGGFAMLMAEFLTAIQHELPIKVVINNNNSLGKILWEQMVLGYPEHGVRYPEPFVDYAAFATANGALGVKVASADDDVKSAVRMALDHPGPALVDVNVNPAEPPLPGKVEYDAQGRDPAAQVITRGRKSDGYRPAKGSGTAQHRQGARGAKRAGAWREGSARRRGHEHRGKGPACRQGDRLPRGAQGAADRRAARA